MKTITDPKSDPGYRQLFALGIEARGQDKRKYFEACFEKLMDCEPEEVAGFVGQTECYKKHASRFFWASEVPLIYLDALLNKETVVDILTAYFRHPRNEEHISHKFLAEVARKFPAELVRVVRETQSFLIPAHMESLSSLRFLNDTKLHPAIMEWQCILRVKEIYRDRDNYFKGLVKNFSFEEILIHFVAYNERNKRRNRAGMNNSALQVSIETNLIRVLNSLLSWKVSDDEPATTEAKFLKDLETALPPQNTVEGMVDPSQLPLENITDGKLIFQEMIDFYWQRHVFDHHVELYCLSYCNFDMIDEDEISLVTTPAFAHYKRNDMKKKYVEYYTINKATENEVMSKGNVKIAERKIEVGIATSIAYFNTLFLPLEVTFKSKSLDLVKVFTLLKGLSEYLMPEGNHCITDGVKTLKTTGFSPIHHELPENYLVRFEYRELIDRLVRVFKWERAEVNQIIDFLTVDLGKANEIDLYATPVLRKGDLIYWCSTFLRDRDWPVLMQKRLTNDKLNEATQNESNEEVEKALADTFNQAGFSAKSNVKYYLDKVKYDFDVLAYADNTLFLIELKTTYAQEEISSVLKYMDRTYSTKAVDQLSRGRKYIQEHYKSAHFEKVRDKLGITCSLDDLEVVPLIVSNIFDGDDIFYGDDILKVSLFELGIILRNDLYWLLNFSSKMMGKEIEGLETLPIYVFEQMQNSQAPGFKNSTFDASEEACNLWTQPDRCSAGDLKKAIAEDRVWSFLDELWDMSVFSGNPNTLKVPGDFRKPDLTWATLE